MKGGEPFQPVTAKADRSNGYVKGNKGMADVQPKASEMVNSLSLPLSLSLSLTLSLSLSLSLSPSLTPSPSPPPRPPPPPQVGYTKAAQVHPNVLKRVKRENPADTLLCLIHITTPASLNEISKDVSAQQHPRPSGWRESRSVGRS